MGFSNFMGLMGGMARAGEQVADKTLERMDASAIAKAKEEAQIRLEQRTEQAAIAREGRVSSREDFTYKRGLMDDKAKIADARQARLDEEVRTQDPAYIAKVVAAKNQEHTGLIAGQESSAKNKAEVNKTSAETEKLKAEVEKIKKESEAIGAGGAITEPQTMARLSVGADMIKARFGMKLDKTGFMMDDSAIQDREGMDKALVLYENRVRAGEQPYAAYESVIKEYNGVASATKAASDERAQRGINNLNENKPILRFDDYTREEFDALPKEEQDKAINQSKAPIAPKQSAPVLPPMATRKDGDVIEVGGVKRSWNSQANGGKGGWGVVQAAPVAPAKPRGLMPEAGAATMPQNTPETPSLADRAEAARQRMHELANKTNYINPDASPAAKEWDAKMRQKAIDDDAGAKTRNANRAARPEVKSGLTNFVDEFKAGSDKRAAEARAKAKVKETAPRSELAPGSTPAPTSTTTDLTPIGLTATGAKVEAEYQALLNKDVSAIEFAKRLGKLLNDPEFRNNHPDLVKRYKIYQSEAADEVNKGSR